MYALFLETKAAQEIDKYVERHGGDAEDIKQRLYKNSKEQIEFRERVNYDDWWVNQCLKNDSHKLHDVNSLAVWRRTPEGHGYWAEIAGW